MSVDSAIKVLDENNEVIESYVLLREIKAFLDVGHDSFNPKIAIKIYKSSVSPSATYHFDVSHHVHTPEQAGPYLPSRSSCESEREAIKQAIYTTTSFIKSALLVGHKPSETWLIPNDEF